MRSASDGCRKIIGGSACEGRMLVRDGMVMGGPTGGGVCVAHVRAWLTDVRRPDKVEEENTRMVEKRINSCVYWIGRGKMAPAVSQRFEG